MKYGTAALSHAKLGISGSKLRCSSQHCATFRYVTLRNAGEAPKQPFGFEDFVCAFRGGGSPLTTECPRIQRYRSFTVFPLAFVLCQHVTTQSPFLACSPALSRSLPSLVLILSFPPTRWLYCHPDLRHLASRCHAAFLIVRGALLLVRRPCQSRLASVRHLYLHGSLFYVYCLGHHIIPMLGFDLPHSVGNMPSLLLVVSFWCLIVLSLYTVPLPRSFTNYQSFCPHPPPICPYYYFRPHDLEKPL